MSDNRLNLYKQGAAESLIAVRRAFAEFLTLPTCIIVGFLLLAVGMYVLDQVETTWLTPVRSFLRSNIFTTAGATADFLSAIAAGILGVTSITITLLLIVVQQSAASLTTSVFDQFLRRRLNQFYFGFFVGLALYSLITLATVNDPFIPVFGGTVALLGIFVALYLLILLLYTTINQMRPVEIIEAIHDHTLRARERQLRFIARTRRASRLDDMGATTEIESAHHGFVTHINLDLLGKAIEKARGEVEIVLTASIGSYVAFGDVLARVHAQNENEAKMIGEAVRAGIRLERRRDIKYDPAYGIEQLEMLAWTSISTSKSNPAPGLLTIFSLRDVLARWSTADDAKSDEPRLPIVYEDNTFARLLDAFETFGVVSSESMQHQNYIEVVNTFSLMFDRLPAEYQSRAEDLILRILSVLGDHALTAELNKSLSRLICALNDAGRSETASAVQAAQARLAESVGKLNSRSTRATGLS